jgi:hypothetical protein
VWVNNAFAGIFAPFTEITPDDFRWVTEVTYLGYVFGTRAALRHMLPRDRGTIVQVGSALAYRGIPLQSAYCGAKHAIQGLGAPPTPFRQWGRIAALRVAALAQRCPYDDGAAARAVVHAAAHGRRREYWVGGSTAATLIANAVVPGVLDRYMARTAFEAQQDEGAHGATGNLWSPADGPHGHDFGAHGRFAEESRPVSRPEWMSLRRGQVGKALAVGAGVLAARRLTRLVHRRA